MEKFKDRLHDLSQTTVKDQRGQSKATSIVDSANKVKTAVDTNSTSDQKGGRLTNIVI